MAKRIDHYRELLDSPQIEIPIGDFLGMRLIEIEEGSATVETPTQPNLLNTIGYVQGGILASIADETMAIAFASCLEEEEKFTSVEFKINFIRPVIEGTIIAKAKVIHRGNRTGMAECNLYNSHEKLAAKASGTFIFL